MTRMAGTSVPKDFEKLICEYVSQKQIEDQEAEKTFEVGKAEFPSMRVDGAEHIRARESQKQIEDQAAKVSSEMAKGEFPSVPEDFEKLI